MNNQGLKGVMNHQEKIAYFREDLLSRGFEKAMREVFDPPIYRLAWFLGWEIEPPVFQGFLKRLFFQALWAFPIFTLFFFVGALVSDSVEFDFWIIMWPSLATTVMMTCMSKAQTYHKYYLHWKDYPMPNQPLQTDASRR